MSRKRWMIVALVFLALAAVVVAAPYLRGKPLAAEERLMKAAGLPTTYAEIYAMGPTSGSDAAQTYKKFNDEFANPMARNSESYEKDKAMRDAWGTLISSEPLPTVLLRDAYAEILRPYLQPLIEASKQDRWTLVGEDGKQETVGQISTVLVRIGDLACADARKGDFNKAFEELRAIARISQQVGRNPNFFMKVSGMRYERIFVNNLGAVVRIGSKDPAIVKRAIDLMHALPPQPDVRIALQLECSLRFLEFRRDPTIEIWRQVSDAEVTPIDRAMDRYYAPQVRRWEATEIRLRLDALRQMPPGEVSWDQAAAVYKTVAATDTRPRDQFGGSGITFIPQLLDFWAQNLATRQTMLTALRLQALRLKDGVIPASLPDFGDESTDPFTRLPLSYRVDSEGFVVWSVDRDRSDNGGVREPPKGKRNFDIVAYF